MDRNRTHGSRPWPALLTRGLDQLATLGARRLKVGFDGVAGRDLYLGAGFVETATLRSFRRPA